MGLQLVILAAGVGRRFGGLKQITPVSPSGEARVAVLQAKSRWCGITSPEDLLVVKNFLAGLKAQRIYPDRLWALVNQDIDGVSIRAFSWTCWFCRLSSLF